MALQQKYGLCFTYFSKYYKYFPNAFKKRLENATTCFQNINNVKMFPLSFLILEIRSRSRRIEHKLEEEEEEEEEQEEVDNMATIQILCRDVLWRWETKQSSSLWTMKMEKEILPSIDCIFIFK